jgi:hypothetical protein
MIDVAPNTEERVEENTDERINQRIRREMEARVLYYAERPEEIDSRLAELDEEWDVERVLETGAGSISLLGLTLATVRRRWLMLPAFVAGFLVQHAIQGWCPPVAIVRRLGIRTTKEINHERFALKALRGDFRELMPENQGDPRSRAEKALQATEPYAWP